MKKTHKNILGLVGLLLVVAMTIFAAFLPSPDTSAMPSSVANEILVRVVSPTERVEIDNPKNGQVFVGAEQTITYEYENVETVTVTMRYTDMNGHTITRTIKSFNPTEQIGTDNIPLNLYEEFGYGDFVLHVIGTGAEGFYDEHIIEFSFYPVTGEAAQKEGTDDVIADLDYDESADDIDYIEVNVYDENMNLIKTLSPIKVTLPNKTVVIPFGEHNMPNGKYYVEFTAINTSGEALKPSHISELYYTAGKKPAPMPVPETGGESAPNTGGLFEGLNISRADYLITGLIIFFMIGICGIVLIVKSSKNNKRR